MNIKFNNLSRLYILAGLSLLSVQFPLTSWGAVTDLANVPMAVKNAALPNFLFVTDDSGSMGSEIMLSTNDGALWWHTGDKRFVGRNASDGVESGVINFNSAGNADATWKKYTYLFPNGTSDGERTYGDSTHDHYAVPPTAAYAWLRSSAYNSLYYNPSVTYKPWPPSNNGTSTTTYGNASTTAAKSHPILGSRTHNLTNNINSDTANWTFRMWPGMLAPSGARYKACDIDDNDCDSWQTLSSNRTVPNDEYWDVQISYYPATYYVVDPTVDDSEAYYGPDGTTKLRKFEVRSGNTFPSGRSYADELQNFANWFTYYRKRQLLLNASMGDVLDGQNGMRAGIIRFNSRTTPTMHDFSSTTESANERRMLDILYRIDPDGGTPTREALDYAGQQFDTNTNIIQAACQFNIGFVLTDGFAANTSAVSISPANYDGQTNYTTYPYNRQYSTSGATITHPYQDSFDGTLADIAMKYYTQRLRGTGGAVLAAGQVPVNSEDTSPGADQNSNLHMNTYGLALGVRGTIFGTGSAAATNPYSTAPVWPNPNAANRSPAAVDDLWHATLNGRGTMYRATDLDSLKSGINSVINDVTDKTGSAAAVTVSNPNIVVGGINASYNSSYNSGNWSGDLKAYPISTIDGTVNTNTPLWSSSARDQLNARTAGIYAPDARKIVTYSGVGQAAATGSGGLQFHSNTTAASASITSKLTDAQDNVFETAIGSGDADAVIKYIRGDRSKEGVDYRSRTHILGDIINAEPVIVQKPILDYIDSCYSTATAVACGTTDSFKTAQAGRESVIFQPANDGMVHAFNASTGAEDWAYVPKLIWPDLVTRTKKSGFEHKYYIDATPVAGDVDFKNTVGGSSLYSYPTWKTILVGGFGKGAKGFYALDVTTPSATSEIDAATKILWEFPNSTTSTSDADNMGYSFGRPIIAKTDAYGWVVIVASGYNNTSGTGTGRGYLYVLNPRNGAVIKRIDTGAGSTTDPAGLAKISGYVENADLDNTVTHVYGGDLFGNVWRFKLTGNHSGWTASKLAALVDSSGNVQPVTTEPELATVTISNADYRFVYVGTGKYLGDTDIGTTQVQTMYGLIDDLSNSPLITIGASRAQLGQQTMSAATDDPDTGENESLTRRVVSNNAISYSGGGAKRGWYLDLTLSSKERIVTDPQLALGAIAFTTNIPSSDSCVPGGSSWFYTIDYATGGIVSQSTSTYSGTSLGSALASRPTMVKLPSGAVKAIIRLSDATTVVKDLPVPSTATSGRRVSWREVITN